MRLITSLTITLLVSLNSCSQDKKVFTDIKTTKSDNLTRIKGSNVFVKAPDDYQYVESQSRFQKSGQLFFQMVESNQSFLKTRQTLKQDFVKQNGSEVDIWNEIKVNEYEGVYFEGPSASPGMTSMYLGFGDNNFVVMVIGIVRTADQAGQNELRNIFQTIYYDNNSTLDPLELANFEFDQSITQFKLTTTISNVFTFNKDTASGAKTKGEPYIQIFTLQQLAPEKAEAFLRDYLRRVENSGTKIDAKDIKSTTINGYPAYEVESSILIEGKTGYLYEAILRGQESSVLFVGFSTEDIPKYKDEFVRTAKTIRIK